MNVDYNGFLTELRQFVASQDSGFVRVLRKARNPVIAIGVIEGKITTVSCGSIGGRPALDRIRDMEGGMLHVQRIKFSSVDTDLPKTEEILSLLGDAGDLRPSSRAGEIGAQVIDRASISDRVLPMLRQYIGPMADFVWDDELATLDGPLRSTEVQAFISKLANNIKDPSKRERFMEEALKALPGNDQ